MKAKELATRCGKGMATLPALLLLAGWIASGAPSPTAAESPKAKGLRIEC